MKTLVVSFLVVSSVWCSAAAIGPIEIPDSDSSAIVKLQLASQLQTTWDNQDRGEDNERESSLTMKIRRVRPSLSVVIPDYRTSFRLHLNLSPGSSELMDFYFDTRPAGAVNLRIGQYKIPFTRYRIQSFQRLTLVDWSIVTRYFGAERQLGIAIHNGYEKAPAIGYVVGVFNGINARGAHATQLARVYGEAVVNRSDLSGTSPTAEFHPELVCHFAFGSRNMSVSSDSDPGGRDLRYHIASSVAWDLDPDVYQDLALRLAQELLIKYQGASFMAVVYVGFTDIGSSLRTRKAFAGLLAQSSYRLSNHLELSTRYAHVDIDSHLADLAYDRAQSIIAAGDESAVRPQYVNAGMLLAEHEGTIGVNIYLYGHNLKVQNDIGFIWHERRGEDLTDFVIRSQLQLAF